MKVQIPEWDGDAWREWTDFNPAFDAKTAAETYADSWIREQCYFDRIGKDPITVHVDDGEKVTTWRVETEHSFICYATEKQGAP